MKTHNQITEWCKMILKAHPNVEDANFLRSIIEMCNSCEDAISRQAVLEEINRIGINAFATYNDYSGLFDFVDTLPSVQPEQKLIRCKDCKHLYQDGECPLRLWKYHVENDFCSYGEKISVNCKLERLLI